MTGFARALRANGIAADGTRLGNAIEALGHVDLLDTAQVYWTGRVTLCGEPDDLPRYDAVFDAWFRGRLPPPSSPVPAAARGQIVHLRPLAGRDTGAAEHPEGEEHLASAASAPEVLRHRDLSELSDAERDEINTLIALLAPRVGTRPTRRYGPRGRDRID